MLDNINSHKWIKIQRPFAHECSEYICSTCGTTGFSVYPNNVPTILDEDISCDDCVVRNIIE
jgi:DNA-directed RNA polymerase subunit RPC12/RpoP